jgi:hypothetical protein
MTPATVDDPDAAQAVAYGRQNKVVYRKTGFLLIHTVQIQVGLHRKSA